MIKRIFCFAIPLFCVIAIFLKSLGVDQIEFGKGYYTFMSSILQRSEKFVFAIPSIPPIPEIDNGFVDALIGFVNGLSGVINVLSTIFNVSIKVISFVLGLLEAGIDGLRQLADSTFGLVSV